MLRRVGKEMSDFHCKLCDVTVQSEKCLRQHYGGRQHQLATEKADIAQRSVYVRGFPPQEVKEQDVKALFEQFGTVTRVSLDTAKHLFAIVQFATVASALAALQHHKALRLYGKKLVVKPREFKPRKGHEAVELPEEVTMDISVHGNSDVPHVIGGIHLPEEVHAKLEQAMSMEEQIQVLTTGCSLPDKTLEAHLSLCHHLHSIFQGVFPRCIIVPFGAPISGNATLSSDCDLCLITEPTEHDQQYLSGQNYYSMKHLAIWERLSATNSPPPHEAAPDEGSSMQTSKRSSHYPQQFELVQATVQSIPGCTHIVPIPFARCPIVRFRYVPSQIHCDLSVDNRLGPYNTRLLRSYYEFDQRVIPLVLFIRLWARASGIKRTQLSSYAISLMVVYALQNTTPPVLPCLQNPRGWPKNMQRLASQGFTTSVPVVVDGWSNDFTLPSFLMPSTNTASTVELLLHFFQFYTEHFDFSNHVIAIHNPPTKPLTILEASELAKTRMMEQQPSKLKEFKVSPVCIQDPFELSHNVTKSFVMASLILLQNMLKCAMYITHQQVQSEVSCHDGNLMSLFNKHEYLNVSSALNSQESVFATKIITFTTSNVATLLKRVDSLKPLASRLRELDLGNPEIVQKLTLVVMKALIAILEQYLSFVCQPIHGETSSEVSIGSFATELSIPPPTVNSDHPVADRETRKRQREEQQTEPRDESPALEDPKKVKLASTTTALDLLYSAMSGMAPVYMCTTHANTWIHRRQTLRQQKREHYKLNKLAQKVLPSPQVIPSEPTEDTTASCSPQIIPSEPMEDTTASCSPQVIPSEPTKDTTASCSPQVIPSEPMEDTTASCSPQVIPSEPTKDTTASCSPQVIPSEPTKDTTASCSPQVIPSEPMEDTTASCSPQVIPSEPMEDTTASCSPQVIPSEPTKDTTASCSPQVIPSEPTKDTTASCSPQVIPSEPTKDTTASFPPQVIPSEPTKDTTASCSPQVIPSEPTKDTTASCSPQVIPREPTKDTIITSHPSTILEPENRSIFALAHSLPTIPPILHFVLSTHTTEQHIVAVSMKLVDPLYTVVFSQFFAYFKKLVIHTHGQVAV